MRKLTLYSLFPLALGIAIGFYMRESRPAPKLSVSPKQTVLETETSHLQQVTAGRPLASFKGSIDAKTSAAFSIAEIQSGLLHLKDIPEVEERKLEFAELICAWLELDGRNAFLYILGLEEGPMKQKGMTLAVEMLARSDTQLLAQKALTLPNSRSRTELIRGLANIWASIDVESALSWTAQLPEGVDKNDALFTVRSLWASLDPEAVSAQISQMPENSSTASLITTIATRWASDNSAKAINWANTLPETQKNLALSSIVSIWAQRDPLAAASYAVQLPFGDTQDEAVKSVISSWAAQDPAKTAAWVLQFPSSPLQDQALRQVVSAWNDADSQVGQEWALKLPSGSLRDAALKYFAEGNAYWTPEKAARLVTYISDPSEQEKSIKTVIRSWSETDPKSARNWLTGLNASEDMKNRIRSFLPAN